MLSRSVLLIFVFALANAKTNINIHHDHKISESVFPKDMEHLKTLTEFVDYVNKNDMNVSVIVSEAVNYKNGNLKEVTAMTMTFPVNTKPLSESKVTFESVKPLFKAAQSDKLAIRVTKAENNKMEILTNYREGLPINKAFKIFSGIKNGKTGFVFDEENYIAQYTFLTPGADGHNLTTRVITGKIDIEVLKKANVDDKEITIMKEALVDAYASYEEDDIPKAIVIRLTKKIPDMDWQVAGNVGDDNFVESSKWAMMRILEEKFLMYAI